MARAPVMAAGGIVLRREQTPLVAVVRLRKRDEWVLPKGKLDHGETPRAAAKREVIEETGHDVTVHEFLGTLVYEAAGRSKIVHYWRMEAGDEQTRELMNDIRAVDWLPLEAALERLSRPSERAFLANVGPQALASLSRKARTKPQAARKRRGRTVVAPEPALPSPLPALPQPDEAPPLLASTADEPAADDLIEAEAASDTAETELPVPVMEAEAAPQPAACEAGGRPEESVEGRRRSLAQKVRDWLGLAA
jgi:8-oxo-dGTP diphosphatase